MHCFFASFFLDKIIERMFSSLRRKSSQGLKAKTPVMMMKMERRITNMTKLES